MIKTSSHVGAISYLVPTGLVSNNRITKCGRLKMTAHSLQILSSSHGVSFLLESGWLVSWLTLTNEYSRHVMNGLPVLSFFWNTVAIEQAQDNLLEREHGRDGGAPANVNEAEWEQAAPN